MSIPAKECIISPDKEPRLYCRRCGHLWSSRAQRPPRMCPRCKSSRWDIHMKKDAVCDAERPKSFQLETLRCNQCDHEWMKRVEGRPKKCPVCRSTKWDGPKTHQNICCRCGHVWRKQSDDPKRCPRCQSYRWNVTAYKLQCRRCGHKWITDRKPSESIGMCPSCKSRKWNETPKLMSCGNCGMFYISRSDTRRGRCPSCNFNTDSFKNTCKFCNASWNSQKDGWTICPRCGKPKSDEREERTFDIWTDGKLSLRYVYTDGFSYIYLWRKDFPVATLYFRDMLMMMGITAEQFTVRLSDPRYTEGWRGISEYMDKHSNDYEEKMPYFMKRFSICEFDAAVLSIHFTGMGPEAIAVRFNVPLCEIRGSFDRIMAAYTDEGITVNDSIFTDDPFSVY